MSKYFSDEAVEAAVRAFIGDPTILPRERLMSAALDAAIETEMAAGRARIDEDFPGDTDARQVLVIDIIKRPDNLTSPDAPVPAPSPEQGEHQS